ncbi:tRNA lysidine(34) synthetase TilS [Limisalsivibrio acetivorans]|uniref:tRNA lysidine(34) synthetase TilS n=1 Tax=Limisalsivibrio acetivorans TaxID=1304888 RepID=UPI0003FDC343|nr:tRNA lysidine(34) synthetase TilS [Limisalsivibrio acetivorans]
MIEHEDKRLLVAFSGGKDSASLLHYLCCRGYDVSACHVDHGIRGDNAVSDALFCRSFCIERSIPFYLCEVDVPAFARERGLSPEHAARELRYRELRRVLDENGLDLILTAHTKNDAVESVFIRLFQGASVFSLGVFSGGERLHRPMLSISTEQVNTYNSDNSVSHIYDETNDDNRYMRNWIRGSILKVLEDEHPEYIDNILGLAEDASAISDEVNRQLPVISRTAENGDTAELEEFNHLRNYEKRQFLRNMFINRFRAERRHINDALSLLSGSDSRRLNMPDGFIFEVSCGVIRLFDSGMISDFEIVKPAGVKSIEVPSRNVVATFSESLTEKRILLRNRRAGDRLGAKKLKDILSERRLPLFDRDRLILCESEEGIVFVENIFCNDNIHLDFS